MTEQYDLDTLFAEFPYVSDPPQGTLTPFSHFLATDSDAKVYRLNIKNGFAFVKTNTEGNSGKRPSISMISQKSPQAPA